MGVGVSGNGRRGEVHPYLNDDLCSKCKCFNRNRNSSLCEQCYRRNSTLSKSPSKSSWNCRFCKSKNEGDKEFCSNCRKRDVIEKDKENVKRKCSISRRPMSVSIVSRREQDESNAQKIFLNIVSFCQKNKINFVDDEFPPSNKSLGPHVHENVTKWLRIFHMKGSSVDDEKCSWQILSCQPQPNDVQQGQLGNCWLMAALSLITERPEMLKHILLTRNVNEIGVYLVRICHNGLWKSVVVDDCFPCTDENTFAFSRGRKRQLYVPLIEKACAKIFGSYSNLRGGSTAEGLQLLTGAPCHRIELYSSDQLLDFDLIWAKLLSASESKLLIGVSTGRCDVKMDEYDRIGIHGNHAFSIVLVTSLEINSFRLLLIRDPHGKSNYRDNLIESSTRRQLDLLYNGIRSSGMFWISWWNFLRYFDTITISTYLNNHFDIREVSQFTQSSTESISTYYFYLTEGSSINVSILYHREDRKKGNYHTQSFVLCRFHPESKQIDNNEIILESCRGGFLHWSGSLNPGCYVLLPFSISFWTNNRNEQNETKRTFTLVIHSTIQLNGTFIYEPATFLANCLINAIVKYSHKPEKDRHSIFYVTSHNIGSKMIVLENLSKSKYLNLIVDFNEAKNVRHSRFSLLTSDFIPPCHRQLICILEWTNKEGQSARISYTRTQTLIDGWFSPVPPIHIHQHDLHSPIPITFNV